MIKKILFIFLFGYYVSTLFAQTSVIGINPNGSESGYSTLPVQLVYFAGDLVETGVSLKWGTATETNNAGFYILRRTESTPWEKLDQFILGSGTSNSPKNYYYEDTTIDWSQRYYYYRLWQLDHTGASEYSDSIKIFLFNSLTYFEAVQKTDGMHLSWGTSSERDLIGFEVDRRDSANNRAWITLGAVNGNGTTAEPSDYTFIDNYTGASNNLLTYRIKIIKSDGDSTYSDTINVNYITSVQNTDVKLPASVKLRQNYPNPFNPVTKIEFELPAGIAGQGSKVLLKVYDLLGNEIATLVNEYKQPGIYNIDFDGSRLASGVYLYKLSYNNVILSRKMVLLK